MAYSEKIEILTGIFYIENDILFIRMKKDAIIDIDEAKVGIDARKKLQNGRGMLVFIDGRNLWSISHEAREFSSRKEIAEMSIAVALLTGKSMAVRMIANIFMGLNKKNVPIKMFSTEEKALEWLETFKVK